MKRRRGLGIIGTALAIIILGIIIGTIVFYMVAIPLASFFTGMTQPPTEIAPPKYTKGLIAFFQVYDKTGATFITSDISPEFYASGENPFAYTFVGSPLAVGAYDSVKGAWKTVLDAGSYPLLIKDVASTPTKYPELITISVSGTDEESREVSIDPYMINLVQRAGVSISTTIKAYNTTSGAYDISVTDINITAYDQWLVTFEFIVSGENKIIKNGRIYLTKISGLLPEKAYLDGKQVSIVEDTDASDDGMTGYYVEFKEDWNGGELHRLDIYLKDVGASTGTLTLTLFDYYICLNPALRWWTEETASVSVVS